MNFGATSFGDRRWTQRWVLCGALMLALHGAGVAAILAPAPAPPPIDAAPPAILIDLAPTPTAPPEPPSEIPPGPEQVQAEPEPPPPPPEPEPEPEKIEEPPVVVPDALVSLPPPRPKPKVRPPEPPKPVRKIEPKDEPDPRPPAPQTTAPPRVEAPPPAPVAAAPVETASAAAAAAVRATFQQRLLAHLERHKRYPRAAELRNQQGVGHVRFTMDRQGNVLSFRLERSSGHSALDEEILELIERAQPLPMPPAEQTELEFIAPVQFFLRRR